MKKRLFGIFLILLILITGCRDLDESEVKDSLNAFIIIGNEFGNTYFDMKENLEELGFHVTTVGVGDKVLLSSCPNQDTIEVEVDMLISEIDEDNIMDYSVVFIPAGKHFRTIRYSEDVGHILEMAKNNGLYISSVCSGNIVLASFDGLIEGYKLAASTASSDEIELSGGIATYQSVVVDNMFVTGSTGYGNYKYAPSKEIADNLYELIHNSSD